jgi:hypothetical protein
MQSASTHPNEAFAKIQPPTAQFTFFHISPQQINLERNYCTARRDKKNPSEHLDESIIQDNGS